MNNFSTNARQQTKPRPTFPEQKFNREICEWNLFFQNGKENYEKRTFFRVQNFISATSSLKNFTTGTYSSSIWDIKTWAEHVNVKSFISPKRRNDISDKIL